MTLCPCDHPAILPAMRNTAKYLATATFALLASTGTGSQAPPAPQATPQKPTFTVQVDLVTTDVIVRDSKTDAFVSDLKVGEFEVFEDGVRQEIVSLVLTHGGRVFNVQAPPPAPAQEGIILPPARPTSDAAGRVFLISSTTCTSTSGRRADADLMTRMLKNLVHEATCSASLDGTSSISSSDYDPRCSRPPAPRHGQWLRPADIVRAIRARKAAELRTRARRFSTAYHLLETGAPAQPRMRSSHKHG